MAPEIDLKTCLQSLRRALRLIFIVLTFMTCTCAYIVVAEYRRHGELVGVFGVSTLAFAFVAQWVFREPMRLATHFYNLSQVNVDSHELSELACKSIYSATRFLFELAGLSIGIRDDGITYVSKLTHSSIAR